MPTLNYSIIIFVSPPSIPPLIMSYYSSASSFILPLHVSANYFLLVSMNVSPLFFTLPAFPYLLLYLSDPFLSMLPCLSHILLLFNPSLLLWPPLSFSFSSWQPYSRVHYYVRSREPCPALLQRRPLHQFTCP